MGEGAEAGRDVGRGEGRRELKRRGERERTTKLTDSSDFSLCGAIQLRVKKEFEEMVVSMSIMTLWWKREKS